MTDGVTVPLSIDSSILRSYRALPNLKRASVGSEGEVNTETTALWVEIVSDCDEKYERRSLPRSFYGRSNVEEENTAA